MSTQERLRDLVKEWVRSANAGKPIPLAELCKEAPELLPQVQEKVDHLIAKAKEKNRAASEPQLKVDTVTSNGAPPVEGTYVQAGLPLVTPTPSDGYPSELGGYRLTKILGEGGMGRAYLADDLRLGRQIAIKVMRPDVAMNFESRERFLREARATATLEHDHIITIFQVGEEKEIPFLVMPLLKGEPLDARLKREGKQTVKEAVRIAREMAEGLASAHKKGLIHRDIKPANIWLEASPGRRSGESRVKILDFGLAKGNFASDGGGGLTQVGAIMGTPAYMSPEQARGLPVDARSDLFSLGGVLYQMLTGKRAFTGADTMSILTSLAVDTPPEPVQLDHLCPPVLSKLTMRLLAKNPDDRPASAQILVDELVQFDKDCRSSTVLVPPSAATPAFDPWATDYGEDTEHNAPLSLEVIPPSEKPIATPRKSKKPLFIALGLLAIIPILWLASTFIRVETPDGTLVVEVDNDAEVRFKNGSIQLFDTEGVLKYTLTASDKNKSLPPGQYLVKVTGADGVKLETDQFEMTKNGKATVRVKVESSVVVQPKEKEKGPISRLSAKKPILKFEGFASQVSFPTLIADDNKPTTIEAWVFNENSEIKFTLETTATRLQLIHAAQNDRWHRYTGAETRGIVVDRISSRGGTWIHLAAVAQGNKLTFFTDGKQLTGKQIIGNRPNADQLHTFVGNSPILKKDGNITSPNKKDLTIWGGSIASLRISQSARYDKEFTPPSAI